MSLADTFSGNVGSGGALSASALPPHLSITKIVEFIRAQLPQWAVDPDTPTNGSEPKLNESLSGYLNIQSRFSFFLCHFVHEGSQYGRRRIDLSVKPITPITVEGNLYSTADPLFVIEAKILPTLGHKRAREYVTGFDGEMTGAIQRFKAGFHGGSLDQAAIVAYVKDQPFSHWFKTINGWIIALVGDVDFPEWSVQDQIFDFEDNVCSAYSKSINQRDTKISKSPHIFLHHLWVKI